MTKKLQLTRRRVLGGMATIGAASAAAGAGTMALFSDTESSSDNTVQAGTLNLGDVSNGVWNVTAAGLAPGESVSQSVSLANDGSLDGDHVEVTATNLSENDGNTSPDVTNTGDVSAMQFARNLFIDEVIYGTTDGHDDWFSVITQLPGAFVYDIDQNDSKTADVVAASNPGGGSRSGVVHATSGGSSTLDYTRSIVDVSGLGLTLNDLANNNTEYDFYPTSANTVSAPDEVKLVVEDGNGKHFLFQQVGPAGTDDAWNTRNLDEELNGNPQIDGSSTSTDNGWLEVDLGDGSTTNLGSSPLDEFGGADVHGIGFGAGNFSTTNDEVIDIYFDRLVVAGTEMDFRSRNVSLADLAGNVADNLQGLQSGGSEAFEMTLQLNPEVGNAYQGDGIDFDLEFTLNQEASQ